MRNSFQYFSQRVKVYSSFTSNIRINEREMRNLFQHFLQRAKVYSRFTSNIKINERKFDKRVSKNLILTHNERKELRRSQIYQACLKIFHSERKYIRGLHQI